MGTDEGGGGTISHKTLALHKPVLAQSLSVILMKCWPDTSSQDRHWISPRKIS